MTGISHRIGDPVTERERAVITQLAYDMLEPSPPATAPELRHITLLIVDLRGFSVFADSCEPATLVAVLKPFFQRMTELVHEHGGFVDKFLGDGVMALFGAPTLREDHLPRALTCAARMQQAMLDLNAENRRLGIPEIHAGIGINSGKVMVGSFGLRQLRVKGRQGPITLYEMTAVTAPERTPVPKVEMRTSPRVPVQLPLRFYRVHDKQIIDEPYRGSIMNLGYDGMLARLPLSLPSLSEISFTVNPDLVSDGASDLFARALHSRRDDDGFQTAFAFTSAGTPGHEAVRSYVDRVLWGAAC